MAGIEVVSGGSPDVARTEATEHGRESDERCFRGESTSRRHHRHHRRQAGVAGPGEKKLRTQLEEAGIARVADDSMMEGRSGEDDVCDV